MALDILFPTTCVLCDHPERGGRRLCESCLPKIPRHHTFFCAVCLARRPAPAQGKLAAPCHPGAGYLFGAATEYSHPAVRELLRALKFSSARRAAEPLGELLSRYALELGLEKEVDCIVPVPLGSRRERTRGFNQARLLAEALAARLGKPVIAALLRTRETAAQTKTPDSHARRDNVKNCFAAAPDASGFGGRRILLVDDVRTSGATLDEAVRTLKASGARRVTAIVVARA
mgnify:FL=1